MTFFSLILLAALSPQIGHSASVKVGIVNGTEAKPHSRPYMISLQVNGNHICGGFLINDQFVLTAAHCWKPEWDMTAVLGAHDLNTKDFDRIPVRDHYIHPKFSFKSPSYDIMLLKLAESASNSKHTSCISIPSESEETKQMLCSVAGWGSTKSNGSASNVLLEAKITKLRSEECKRHWDYTNILCAGGLRQGLCQGDSGGPLVCNNTAVGIASFIEPNCDQPKKPNGYTDISKFLAWIREITNSAPLCLQ